MDGQTDRRTDRTAGSNSALKRLLLFAECLFWRVNWVTCGSWRRKSKLGVFEVLTPVQKARSTERFMHLIVRRLSFSFQLLHWRMGDTLRRYCDVWARGSSLSCLEYDVARTTHSARDRETGDGRYSCALVVWNYSLDWCKTLRILSGVSSCHKFAVTYGICRNYHKFIVTSLSICLHKSSLMSQQMPLCCVKGNGEQQPSISGKQE